MSDADRALQRRRTAPRGWPAIERNDEGGTPPPQEQPLPQNDAIPQPIKDQLDQLASDLGAATRAIGRVWDARKDGERLDRVDSKLATLAASATRNETVLDERVIPQLEQLAAATDSIARELPRLAATLEAISINVGALDRRLRDLEVEMRTSSQRWDTQHSTTIMRVDAQEAQTRDHELRLKQLELAANVSKALAKKERTKSGGLGAALGAVAGAVASAIASAIK